MSTSWTGVGTALVTPFTAAGELDEQAVRRLGRRQIDAGIHFLVPCGTTGESPTLTEAERIRIVEILVEEADGRVPVLAGAGGYNTREVIQLADEMQRAGAAGLLSVYAVLQQADARGPLPALPRDRGEHAAADHRLQRARPDGRATSSRRRWRASPSMPNIVGVKEASGNILQMCEVCRVVPPGFIVLSGDDAITLPLMAIGGRGVISVASNEIPGEMVEMVEAAARGDFEAARGVHRRILPLMQVNFVESNPVPVKAAMAAMGLLEESYRLPMCPPRPESREAIVRVLKQLGLLKARAWYDGVHARSRDRRARVGGRGAPIAKPSGRRSRSCARPCRQGPCGRRSRIRRARWAGA